jgi:serine phosphatase RsbU (regulator of sigma subunit)
MVALSSIPEHIEHELALLPTDQKRVDLLNELAYQNRYSNPTLTRDLGREAHRLALLCGYAAGEGEGLRMMGIGSIILSNYVHAIEYLQSAWLLFVELNQTARLVPTAANIGVAYQRMGQFDTALEWHYKAVKLSEEQQDFVTLSNTLSNLSSVHVSLKQLDIARENTLRALQIKEKLSDRYGVAVCLATLGEIYMEQDDLQGAEAMLQNALQMARKADEKLALISVLRSLGRLHTRLQHSDIAWQHLSQALEYIEQIKDRQAQGEVYAELCELLREDHNYSEAETYGVRSLQLALELQNLENESKAHLVLSRLFEAQKDFEKALAHYKSHSDAENRLFQQTNRLQIATLQSKANFERSEREKQLIQQQNRELDQALKLVQSKIKEIEEKNSAITESISYARRIQMAILPKPEDITQALPNSFILYKPKDIVCGDFFWVRQVQHLTLVAAVDCTGHGVPAALMSIIGYNLLNDIVGNKGILEPSRILSQLHVGVRAALKQDLINKTGTQQATNQNDRVTLDGMDIALCAFDPLKREAQFAGAFSSLFMASRSGIEEIKGDKYPIGGTQDEVFRIFTNHRIALQGTEIFYLCSDGFANQIGGDSGRRYGSKKFKDFIATLRFTPIHEQKALFENELTSYAGAHEQMDDVLVVGVKP